MPFAEWWRRFLFLLHRRQNLAELDEEMQLHAELRRGGLAEAGVPSETADTLARRRFGNRTQIKERAFETWSFLAMDNLWRDLSFAYRILWKAPGFTLVAILTLALGVGANTAVFSVVDAVLLRPLPYPAPDRLGSLVSFYKSPQQSGMFTYEDGTTWELVRNHARSLNAAVFSDWGTSVNIGRPGQVQYVLQQRVGSGFFRVLGVKPMWGREFTRAEDRAGGPPVAVISYSLWKRILNGNESLLKKPVRLRGEPYAIVGVMPPGFGTSALADVWTPLAASTSGEGGGANYQIMVRLKPDAAWPRAMAEIEALGAQRTHAMHFDAGESLRIALLPLQRAATDEIRTPILLLWCAVGVVLLICCLNIAGLILARGAGRRHEIATRVALGGGRGQVIVQLLIESLLLSTIAGFVGLGFGAAGVAALRGVARDSLNLWQPVALDGRVFAAACLVTLLSTALFSLYPAWQASRVDLRSSLLEGGRAVAGSRTLWPRRFLIVGEVALGLILLVTAGLLVRSFLFLGSQASAFDTRHVVTATLPLRDARYQTNESVVALFRQALSRLAAVPGIQSAAFSMNLPYERGLNTMIAVRGASPKDTTMTYITPEYFDVLHLHLIRGRAFTDADRLNAKHVLIINQTFARLFFGGRDPLGQTLLSGHDAQEVVGIVPDLPVRGSLTGYAPVTVIPTIFAPAAQLDDANYRMLNTWFTPSCVVRSSLTEADTVARMRRVMSSLDPLLPFAEFRSIATIRALTLSRQRFQAVLMSTFAGLSLLLAAIGIYGLIAQSVTERMREFGIRQALGATLWQSVQSASLPGVVLAATGAVLGCGGAFATVRLLRRLVWGVTLTDPSTFLATALLLLLVATAASLIPAVRLARLDCAEVLRNE